MKKSKSSVPLFYARLPPDPPDPDARRDGLSMVEPVCLIYRQGFGGLLWPWEIQRRVSRFRQNWVLSVRNTRDIPHFRMTCSIVNDGCDLTSHSEATESCATLRNVQDPGPVAGRQKRRYFVPKCGFRYVLLGHLCPVVLCDCCIGK
jgi:hypothetical protein